MVGNIATAFCRNLKLLKKQQIDKNVVTPSFHYLSSFELK